MSSIVPPVPWTRTTTGASAPMPSGMLMRSSGTSGADLHHKHVRDDPHVGRRRLAEHDGQS
jgi:hypothetical protein